MTPKNPLDQAKGYEIEWPRVSELFTEASRLDDPCFVYVIGEEDDGPVKIGRAANPVKRLRTMQVGNPRRMKVEYVLLGDASLELMLHRYWTHFRISGEWFRGESRGELFPILTTAVERQVQFLKGSARIRGFEPTYVALDEEVREAHRLHDFVGEGRDEVRLLRTGGLKR